MRHILLSVFLTCCILSLSAQHRATGLVIDKAAYKSTPYKARLSTRSFAALPPQASLESFCPTPGDQGNYSTCVAFATAHALRSIMWAKQYKITDRSAIDKMVFSPTFVYELIKNEGDNNCQDGSSPMIALELLKKVGVTLNSEVPYQCGGEITNSNLQNAAEFPISDYQTLWDIETAGADDKINATKKALSEGYPVLIGMVIPESFYAADAVWHSQPSDGGPSGPHGKHALCVVGYDDNKEGGCFRIMNSWSDTWADGGFVWVPYKEYGDYAVMALQAYYPRVEEPVPVPEPVPVTPVTPTPEPLPVVQTLLKGTVEFSTNTGAPMTASRVLTRNLVVDNDEPSATESLVAYRMDQSYPSGTRFRFYVNTNTEAYIYAFATDLSGRINKILPFDDLMSPLIGPNSTVAFPSDTKVVRMDENKGTDYMLILYSTGPLDVNELLQKMQAEKGGLSAKMRAALGNRLLEKGDVLYSTREIGFEVGSLPHGGVAPLMIEISHQ